MGRRPLLASRRFPAPPPLFTSRLALAHPPLISSFAPCKVFSLPCCAPLSSVSTLPALPDLLGPPSRSFLPPKPPPPNPPLLVPPPVRRPTSLHATLYACRSPRHGAPIGRGRERALEPAAPSHTSQQRSNPPPYPTPLLNPPSSCLPSDAGRPGRLHPPPPPSTPPPTPHRPFPSNHRGRRPLPMTRPRGRPPPPSSRLSRAR